MMQDALMRAKSVAPVGICAAIEIAFSRHPFQGPPKTVRSDARQLCVGQVCFANGTLAVMDITALHATCYFPYRQLAAFKSLASLALDFCPPNSQVTSPLCLSFRPVRSCSRISEVASSQSSVV